MMASSVFDDDMMSARYSRCLSFSSPNIGLASMSEKPMMVLSGVLELVGDVADEVRFQAVGGDERFVAFDEGALGALGIRHVGERQQRCAIGQRHQRVVDDDVVRADHLACRMSRARPGMR